MVMIAFVGVATFDKPGKGATSILQALIFGKPEAPVEERHTGSFLLFLRFLRSCMRQLGVHTWYSDSDGDLQDPPHTGFSPHSSSNGWSKSSVMPMSGAEGGELTPTLALCMAVFGLMQPPAPQSEVLH
jgi:hypothetical protein